MSIAQDLAAYVSQWDLTGDLQTYAAGIGQMFAEVESYAEDTSTVVGWQPLWDVDLATENSIGWLAMVMGETVPQGFTLAQAQALVKAAPNQDRGTPQAIANAVKQVLTGGQAVGLRERYRSDGTADNDALAVVTWLSQTPDQNAVQSALRRTVPADIDVYYQCLAGTTWTAIEGSSTWATIESGGKTWAQIQSATSLPGYVMY